MFLAEPSISINSITLYLCFYVYSSNELYYYPKNKVTDNLMQRMHDSFFLKETFNYTCKYMYCQVRDSKYV